MSEMSVSRKYRKRSHAAEIWRNFRKNKGAMLGLFILLIIFAIALTIEAIACSRMPKKRLRPARLSLL